MRLAMSIQWWTVFVSGAPPPIPYTSQIRHVYNRKVTSHLIMMHFLKTVLNFYSNPCVAFLMEDLMRIIECFELKNQQE